MSYLINLCTRNQSTSVVSRTDITSKIITGFSVIEKLDSSLDVGSITVRGLSTGTPYDMFDWIEISFNSTLLYSLRIGGDNVQLISKNPLRYEHTLSLVEHTKVLERFEISGKTFTQPTDGTVRYYLYDVLDDLIDTTPFETSTNLVGTRVCVLPTSGDLYDYLTTEEAPEFTFKEVTLRKSFEQVGDYFDGIPRLYINSSDELELTFDLVNELKTLITSESDFIEKSVQQNIDLYATQIESEVMNLVNDNSYGASVEIYPSANSWITARSNDFIFDFLKSYIPTSKRIYTIPKLFMKLNVTVSESGTTVYDDELEFDIVREDASGNKRVVEKKIYQALENTTLNVASPTYYNKNNVIYYSYREQNITQSGVYGVSSNLEVIDNVARIGIYEQLVDDGIIDPSTPLLDIVITINDSIENYKYQVHYVPIPNAVRLSISRQDNTDVFYNSTLIANQQGRIVNLENFTNNLYGRINRIGNSELQLSNREVNIDDLYDIGDYTDELYIITKKEVIFYKDYVYANYELSRNFNKISDFISVNSEVRQYEMGEQNTLNRDLIYKEYIEIDAVTSGTGTNSSQLMQSDGIESYINTFKVSSTDEPVRGAIFTDSLTETSDLSVAMSSNGGGNALIFDWRFVDNKSAGAFRQTNNLSQVANDFAPYTDKDGLNPTFSMYMYNQYESGLLETVVDSIADNLPKTDLTYVDKIYMNNSSSFRLNKDTREVIGGTFLLQQKSKDNEKVGLGRVLSSRNRLVSENPPTTIKMYYSTTLKFNRSNTLNVPSGYISDGTALVTTFPTSGYMVVNGVGSTWASYCLTDENDRILLWVNQDGTVLDTITFDFLNKASDIKYKF
jgi:hypothetical protein